MGNKFEKSIVAQGGSTISNSKNITRQNNNNNSVKAQYTFIGFVLGILSSIIGSYIYEHFIK